MAQRFWILVMSLQLALAVAVAFAVVGTLSGAQVWLGVCVGAVAFVAIQYLLVALTGMVSRALAGESLVRDFGSAVRVALSEPIYFGLAQLSMIFTRRQRSPVADSSQVGRNTGVPLVLVHGLACNRGIWRWLIPGLRAAGFESIYALDLQPLHADIDVLARQLTREVHRVHREHEGSGVTIICHSLGGLVARAALRAIDPEAIRRIVTIGTPHHGAAIARALNWLSAKQMCPASLWLAALNALQEGRVPVPLTSIWSADDNFVRPASSAHLQGATAREMRGLGHFGLLISGRAIDCIVGSLGSPV